MAADGSDVRRLEQLPDGEGPFAYFVDWEPGGSGIVTQGSESVYVVTAADDAATALAPGGIAFWSPDGAWVAYLQDMSRFALVSSDGAEAVDLLVDRPGGFVWSPDATRLVVFTGSGYADTSLDILDAATGEVLAEIPAPGDGYPGHYHYPSWQRVAP